MAEQTNKPLSRTLADALDLSSSETGGVLPQLIDALRAHLGMDVSFISEFSSGRRIFRHVNGGGNLLGTEPDAGDLLEESYCQRIVDGRLPEIIPDTRDNAEAKALVVTERLGIGSYIGTPIKLKDGVVYGTLCCFSSQPHASLDQRDLGVMRLVADMVAVFLEKDLTDAREREIKRQRIQAVLDGGCLSMVYQPIVEVPSGQRAGYEALSRFDAEPRRGPDQWFAEAAGVGLAIELERYAIEQALAELDGLSSGTYLSFNASSDLIVSGQLEVILAGRPLHRLVVEITEHAVVDDYEALGRATRELRNGGLRLAVDDAGSGYASLKHILNLKPDIIKLDMSLTRGMDTDKDRQALASALIYFAKKTGCKVVAEGVETVEEYTALNVLGVDFVQGYYLGRPATIDQLHP